MEATNTDTGMSCADFFSRYGSLLCLALILALFAGIRIRLRQFPLERDEGEYAYAAQLILRGIVPYKLCYTMKLPGTAAAYALLLALFGQTPAGVHLGLLLVNSLSIVLVYFLGRALLGELAGLVSAASFALLSAGPSVLGFAGHATQFVILPALAGMMVLLKAIRSDRLSLLSSAGILFGLAFLMKQPGICFLFFAAFYVVQQNWRRIRATKLLLQLGALALGAILPFAMTCLIIQWGGAFHHFWFWTCTYAQQYGTMQPLSDGLATFWQTAGDVVQPASGIWLLGAMSIFAFVWDPLIRKQAPFLIGLLLFSAAGICPGLFFRPHYFVLLLPSIALLSGAAIEAMARALRTVSGKRLAMTVPVCLFLLAFAQSLFQQRDFFFKTDPVVACRNIYGINPFPESLRIASFLRSRARPGDSVAVMGSEPEIYFYSGLPSATGYVYMYPLMEDQKFAATMQKEMAKEIESAKPEFIVSVGVVTSWMPRPDSGTSIWTWSDRYVKEDYQLIGAVEIQPDRTDYYWDGAVSNYKSQSLNRVLVYQRKAAS